MNANDFMTLATHLVAGTTEAEHRSAVSRAYYAAFHTARLLVQQCGIQLPESAEAHAKVLMCLAQCNDRMLKDAATELGTCRRIRNDADYRLSDTSFEDVNYSSMHVKVAESIIARLVSANTNVIRVPMRAYATQVLKLPVSD